MTQTNVLYPIAEIEEVIRDHRLDPVQALEVVQADGAFAVDIARDQNGQLLQGCWCARRAVVSVAYSQSTVHCAIHSAALAISVGRDTAADHFAIKKIAIWRDKSSPQAQSCPPKVLADSLTHLLGADDAGIEVTFDLGE